MPFGADDHAHMARALQLAAHGLWSTTPNPRVGCVIVQGGKIVGEGWHARAGEAHAEVHALQAAGELARGATAYVTLEPCSHFGRTPPCSDALIRAGIARVVAAIQDPNPRVAGAGLARLAEQGIATACGLLAEQARELNRGFVKRMEYGLPWTQLKLAASLDGRTALANGQSKWITGALARQDVQRQRARACAILTGVGSVLADNPQMNVRELATPRQPLRIIADSALATPAGARILQGGATLIACADSNSPNAAALRAAGAELLPCPGADGRVDLPALLAELGRRGINELMVEAGPTLAGALLATGAVDEILLYMAPALMGRDARGLIDLTGLARMADVPRYRWHDIRRVGDDLRLTLRPQEPYPAQTGHSGSRG